jgi:hypothetical protein
MSHVDEGQLHAFLDGALDHLPAAEARRIREHLERCGECRTRLEAAADLRRRASGILDGAAPTAVDPPPFETLRRRAAEVRRSPTDTPPPSTWERARAVAWAASVVLALGVGWGLGVGGPFGAEAPGVRTAARAPAPSVPAPAGAEEGAASSDAGPDEAGEPDRLAEVDRADVRRDDPVPEEARAEATLEAADPSPDPVPEVEVLPPGSEAGAAARSAAAESAMVAEGMGQVRARRMEAPAPEADAPRPAGAAGARAMVAGDQALIASVDLREPGGELVIPEASVEGVEVVGTGAGTVVRVTQRLPSGEVVEVLRYGTGSPEAGGEDPPALPLPAGWERASVRRADGSRVEVRGSLPRARIEALLEQLGP